MLIILNHMKNPDIAGGYHQKPKDKKQWNCEVKSMSEAKAVFLAWIERNGLGAGNMTSETGNLFANLNATEYLGMFTYNGKWWPNGEPRLNRDVQHRANINKAIEDMGYASIVDEVITWLESEAAIQEREGNTPESIKLRAEAIRLQSAMDEIEGGA